MPQRIFDKFYWLERRNVISSNLAVYIGNQLIQGSSIPDALLKASKEVDNSKQKRALKRAAELIKSGLDIGDAFYETRVSLRGRDRYILALDIDNQLKGKIIKSWSESKFYDSDVVNYIFICIISLVFCLVSIPIFPFVLPQFYEILSGMNIPTGSSLKIAFNLQFGGTIIFSVLLITMIILFIIFRNFFKKRNTLHEEANFLAMLSVLNEDNQTKILKKVVNDICFPKTYLQLLTLVNGVNSGEDIDIILNKTRLSKYLIWLLNLNLYSKDRKVLKEGSQLINENIMLSSISSIKIIEILVVIAQSLFFLFMADLVFGSYNRILIGSLLSL